MGIEIERKFLVNNEDWKKEGEAIIYKQGYLSSQKEKVVRVRIAGTQAFLTIKGKSEGIERLEFEYKIPVEEAEQLLKTLCERPIIEKTRTKIEYHGFVWEVDEFAGENQGLVVAEIELPTSDTPFKKPLWIGEEVSGDSRYYNSNLIKMPFTRW
ncbi:MAG: CYTH domain-containing protein [Cytophagales bacterium]|nr:CYTH domain-containing protein [Cytophagales bacterium]